MPSYQRKLASYADLLYKDYSIANFDERKLSFKLR